MAGLRKKVKGLNIGSQRNGQAADIDPEDDLFSKQPASDEESGSYVSEDENAGREHYEAVGKSKLRKPEKSKIDDKKYGGQAVSRSKIFQDDEDEEDVLAFVDDEDEDPFAVAGGGRSQNDDCGGDDDDDDDDGVSEDDDLPDGDNFDGELADDDEIDSDEAFEEGEEDKMRGKGFVFRGSGKDLKSLPTGDSDSEGSDEDDSAPGSDVSGSDQQSDLEMEDLSAESGEDEDGDSENISHDDEDDQDESEDELTARPRPSTLQTSGYTDREKLKALISNDAAALASSLSASLSADAKKGTAVKKQNQTFDRLLDARIKLQKGLTASNDLHPSTSAINNDGNDANAALRKAEEAALKLYSTIESLRHSILESTTSTSDQASKKRKRPQAASLQTSNSDIWSRLKALETRSLPFRRQTLDKWSSKTRASAALPTQQSKLSNTSSHPESKLSSVLDAYLVNETPKILLNQTLPSPPNDDTTTTTKSPIPHYDDATFYQSLLRDLINSRATMTNLQLGATSMPIVPMKLHASGNAAKARKIDTKASKGRKIRYTVHEKLEHFMAGEGRGNSVGQWNEGAVSEFFASLLGQRGMLGEDDDGNLDRDEDEEVEGEGREHEALRLFRT